MYKLFKKSQIWFALLWIILYVVGSSVADGVSELLGVQKLFTLVFHLALSVIALLWLKKHGLCSAYGICKPRVGAKRFLYYLPLVLLASCNLWLGVSFEHSIAQTLLFVGSMLCVGFLEELIFRGFLFVAMVQNGRRFAIIVSSVTFGIGHIVNLFNGSGAELLPTLMQIVGAVAFGFLFVVIFDRGGSLLPCIFTHSILNALSIIGKDTENVVVALVVSVVALGYTLVLNKTLPKEVVQSANEVTAYAVNDVVQSTNEV